MTEIWLAFIAGLAGSGHCLGMCGGIVAALALRDNSASLSSKFLSQVWYNLGRISTYALLGVTAGMAGSSLDLLAVKSTSFWIFCAADLVVIALGVGTACKIPLVNLSSLEACAIRLFERVAGQPRSISGSISLTSYPLGLLLGFLPCGLVYGPLIIAVENGPIRGGAIMVSLGLGTMPVLLLAGSASAGLSKIIRDRMLRVAGVAVATMGIVALWRAVAKMG